MSRRASSKHRAIPRRALVLMLLPFAGLTLSACDSGTTNAPAADASREQATQATVGPDPAPTIPMGAATDTVAAALPVALPDPVPTTQAVTATEAAAPTLPAVQPNPAPADTAPTPTPPPVAVAPGVPAGTGPDLALRGRIAAALPEEGAVAFARRCADCHSVEEGRTLVGPSLFDVVAGPVARNGYAYSTALRALGDGGATWNFERLDAFIAAPRATIAGTRMLVGEVVDAFERASILAFLRMQSPAPVAIEGVAGAEDDGRSPATFTAEQAEAGRHLYQARDCAFCHAADLTGLFDFRGSEYGGGPALVGGRFLQTWRTMGLDALFATIRDRMPPSARGTLPPEDIAALLAYILTANGFDPGSNLLPADVAVLATLSLRQPVVTP